MSKVAYYLQEHLNGEVITTADARKYFSTDASIFSVAPTLVVYPKNENDVRKTARFTWQLAERGRVIPITARGSGTNTSGAAIGSGIILAFPAHMHRILELDEKSGTVTVEPGSSYGKLQQTLQTHGRFLPPYPASLEYSTIGGAVANNSGGEKSIKYGSTRDFVKGLRVVLSNGEVIETRRLGKREFSHKLGLSSFEGEIYRAVDALLDEAKGSLDKITTLGVTKNTAGYALGDIKRRDGSFDLTPLIVGSQGTLGLITEIVLDSAPVALESALFVGHFDNFQNVQAAITELRSLSDLPSAIEMVDSNLLETVSKVNPNLLKDVITGPYPRAILFVEFDNSSDRAQKKITKKAKKIFDHYAAKYQVETEPALQEQQWRIRHSVSTISTIDNNGSKAVPVIDDGVVPVEHFAEYVDGIYKIFANSQLQVALWGHAGDGNLHLLPVLNLSQVGDRQKAYKLMEEYNNLVISLGGSTSGEYNDGRLRAPYLNKLYGDEMYGYFQKAKQIFDPYGLLNPGVKISVSLDDIKPLMRQDYSVDSLFAHLPRS
jgi:FAD/FMN-containing dehydrogenase